MWEKRWWVGGVRHLGVDAAITEPAGHILRLLLREAVDDPRLPVVRRLDPVRDLINHLGRRGRLLPDGVRQVLAERGRSEHLATLDPERLLDVGLNRKRRRRGHHHERDGLELDLDHVELLVVRSEVVAPLAATVHLVNDDPLEPVLLVCLKPQLWTQHQMASIR